MTAPPSPPPPREPIAVVGISVLYPGSSDVPGFWRNIVAGRDLLSEVPPTHWLIEDYYDPDPAAPDKTYGKRGGFLSPIAFDPVEFGIPPNSIASTDPAQLLGLVVAQRVLAEAAGGALRSIDRSATSVILGVASATELACHMADRLQRPVWLKALRDSGIPEREAQALCDRIAASYLPWQESTFPGLLGNVVAGRIANRLDLGGTNCVVDAACASSFGALAMACNELHLGQSELVITGGVDALNNILMYTCFSKTPALSPTGDCRPFSAQADGTMLGEGVGMLALRRLSDAERDGNPIYAVLRSVGSSSDGRAKSVYAPLAAGQARALRRAYDEAGFSPSTVELIEAHGTGTVAGDAAEVAGLRQIFEESGRADRTWCALGSVKSQLGHTKAAAGAAGLIKAILAVHHGTLPPTIKIEEPNPALGLASSPFYLNTTARPWIRDAGHPRRAGVSSFGFGGSNFHVTVEEYRGGGRRPPRIRCAPGELVLLGAATAGELASRCRALGEELAAGSELAALARRTQLAFQAGDAARLALVCTDAADLRDKLAHAAAQLVLPAPSLLPGLYLGSGAPSGSVALLFPGQGSQYVGMGAELAMAFPFVREVWDRAAASAIGGLPGIHHATFPPRSFTEEGRLNQERTLTRTEVAQPALGAFGAGALTLLRKIGLKPALVAGHSFGEVMALHAAGALGEADLLGVARARGELMAQAAATTPGAMLAVVASEEQLLALLAAQGIPMGGERGLTIANYNSPDQLVLSGATELIAAAQQALDKQRIATRRLPVATAFHSPIVGPASAALREHLRGVSISAPRIPVIACADAAEYPAEPEAIRDRLAAQLAQPVRWTDQIRALYERGARIFVEVGPGGVLTGLTGQCLRGRPHLLVGLDRRGQPGLLSLWHALAPLCAAGVPLDLGALWEGAQAPEPARPAPKLAIQVSGTLVDKPYPPSGGRGAPPPLGRPAHVSSASLPGTSPGPDPSPEPSPMPHNPLPPAPPSAVPPAAAAPPSADPAWLQAYVDVQRQTAEAHAAYQQAMAQSHQSFLRTAEGFALGLVSFAQGAGLPPPTLSTPAPLPALVPPVAASPQLGPAQPPAALPPPPQRALPPPVAPAAPVPAVPAAAPAPVDLQELLIAVVADKTGYPKDVLGLEVELESGLGIDSIKRVEILSALAERMPGLPEVRSNQMASLRTLGDVLSFFKDASAGRTPAAAAKEDARPFVDSSAATVRRFVVVAEQRPAPGFTLPSLLAGGLVAVCGEVGELGPELVRLLGRHGIEAAVSDEVPAGARGVLWISAADSAQSFEMAREAHRAAFRAAQAAGRSDARLPRLLVTVQDRSGPLGPWQGGLAALVKTAGREWPGAGVKAIDLVAGERSAADRAAAIVTELLTGGDDVEVGLRADGSRWVPMVRPAPLSAVAPAPSALEEGAVLLVSGGARGITAATVLALCRQQRLRVALLGRSPLEEEPAELRHVQGDGALKQALLGLARARGEAPTPAELGARVRKLLAAREIRATLTALHATGSQARYYAVDLRDAAALSDVISDVHGGWGPIAGVVHGAGVLADRLIADKTAAQFDEVFDTKVAGLQALLTATRKEPLRILLLYSSIAARQGNAGQCDYAMANAVLDQAAQSESIRRGDGCLVRSIAWGPWEGGMVTPSLREHFLRQSVPLIPLAAGAQALVQELSAGEPGPTAPVDPILVAGELAAALPPPAGPQAESPVREVQVHKDLHPYLDDHRIKEQGTAVLPAVLVLEWFARAAAPSVGLPLCVRDVLIRRGAPLPHFESTGHSFTIRQSALGKEALRCELLNRECMVLYSAQIEASRGAPPAGAEPLPPENLRAAPELCYGPGRLFHGPAFQVLRELGEITEAGVTATLRGSEAMGWTGGPWRIDPAALDGGLQLAILWGRAQGLGSSLPTRIGELRVWGPAPGSTEVSICTLAPRHRGRMRIVVDLRFADARGRLWAELEGVELHELPEEQA